MEEVVGSNPTRSTKSYPYCPFPSLPLRSPSSSRRSVTIDAACEST